MNARVIDLVAQGRDRWALAGDQFYVDLDLSRANLPPGTRLQLGSAVVEVSGTPHTGCAKFSGRFGADALRFVNTGPGRDLSFRGINTRVVVPGIVRRGDRIQRL
jgi:MOSC domain-containing protein YiiM